MKNVYTLLVAILIFSNLSASHFFGGEIEIQHEQGNSFKISMSMFRDINGITNPPYVDIDVFQRDDLSVIIPSIHLINDSTVLLPILNQACGLGVVGIEVDYYSVSIVLDPNIFNSPSGYNFVWSHCCRSPGIVNTSNSFGEGYTVQTFLTPYIMSAGTIIPNSSPILNSHVSDFAINQHPFYLDFGGYDSDGDSLVFELYVPFDDGNILPGQTTTLSPNFPDPSTQFASVLLDPGYNVGNLISGMGGNSNSLQIDPQSGMLTMLPDDAVGYYSYGIWCKEFRNGELIGSSFRDFQIALVNAQINPNTAPQIHIPQLQALATWSGDTMIFTGSPVCIQFGVTDPDSVADIEIEVVHSEYDPGDLTFVQSAATIINPDTFNTALCFQPDSFLPYATRGDVVALNPGCYDLRGDTLPFYFKFVGYSNAGTGGNYEETIGSAGNIDLFSLIGPSFNFNGTWINLENSIYFDPNGIFVGSQISTPQTFNFIYIDQQPNYPADSSFVSIEFRMPSSISNEVISVIKVFPNPANNVISITGIFQNSELTIYNIQGEKVLTQEVTSESNQISIESLSDGMYFYNILGKEKGSGKLIIKH